MHTAHVASSVPAGTLLRHLTLDLVLSDHTLPGQFVKATVGERKPSFFALASSPGEPVELLIKESGETAEALTALQPGESLSVSSVMGNGFPLDRTAGRPLVILCNGSGISACRPVIEQELAAGLPRPVFFYYGVLTPAHRSFTDDLARWEQAGISVITVVGQPEACEWSGRTGFVQDAARDDGLCREDVSVVLVGLPIMIEQAKALYTAAGCPEEQLLTNY